MFSHAIIALLYQLHVTKTKKNHTHTHTTSEQKIYTVKEDDLSESYGENNIYIVYLNTVPFHATI